MLDANQRALISHRLATRGYLTLCVSVPYSLSPTSRRSAVALAVPLTGIGAEQLRPERRRTVFRPFFSALTKIEEVDPGRHELQCLPF